MNAVETLSKEDFKTRIADVENNPVEWKFLGERPALIDFYATWCGPCKALAPILEELAGDYQYRDRIDVYKIDIDREKYLASRFGIRSVPTLIFIPKDGNPKRVSGLLSKTDLKRMVDDILLDKDI